MSTPVLRQSTALGVFSGTAATHALTAFGTATLPASRLVAWVGVCNNQVDGIGVSIGGYTAVGTAVRQASGHDAVTTYAFEKLNASGTANPGTVTYTGIGTAGLYSWALASEVTGDNSAASSTVLATGVGFSVNPLVGPTTTTTSPAVLLLAGLTTPNIQATSLHAGSLFSQVAAGGSGGAGDSSKVTALVAQEGLATTGSDTLSADVSVSRQYAGLVIGVPSTVTVGTATGAPQQFPLGAPDTTGYTTLNDPGILTPSLLAKRWTPTLSNTVDYVLNCPVTRTGPLSIIGGRNVVVPKLLIKIASSGVGEMVAIGGGAAGGIVHIENYHLDPNGFECDAFKTQSGSSGRIVQFKTGRVEKLIGVTARVHADLFQTSGGCGDTWIEDFTGYTTYDGFMMQREANLENQTVKFNVTAGSVIGGTAYELTAPNHTYVAGDPLGTWGITPDAYNGGWTVLSVSGSGSTKKLVVKKGDSSPGTLSSSGFVTKMSFAYNVGSINLNRVNVKGFASVYGGTAVPPEALQSIRFGARHAPVPNAGNPGTALNFAHDNEDQTPLNLDWWAGTLSATNWYATPPSGLVGSFVEPDSGTANYSVIRPVDHVAAGTVPAYCDWPSHPHVSGRLNFGTPPAGDYVIIQGGLPVATAAGGTAPIPPAAPANTTVPTILPAIPLDTDILSVSSLGVWSGTDSTTLYTVNWYHSLAGTASYGSAVTTSGPVSQAAALAFTQALTAAEDGYAWKAGVIANNGTASSEAFSAPTGLIVAPITITLTVDVE